jgi:hypothetical protein
MIFRHWGHVIGETSGRKVVRFSYCQIMSEFVRVGLSKALESL